MLSIAITAGIVLVANTVGNLIEAKLLLQQGQLLTQATQILNASINTIAALTERVSDLCEERKTHATRAINHTKGISPKREGHNSTVDQISEPALVGQR
jgi:hypothetical protein